MGYFERLGVEVVWGMAGMAARTTVMAVRAVRIGHMTFGWGILCIGFGELLGSEVDTATPMLWRMVQSQEVDYCHGAGESVGECEFSLLQLSGLDLGGDFD